MRRPLSSLVFALVWANTCIAWAQQQPPAAQPVPPGSVSTAVGDPQACPALPPLAAENGAHPAKLTEDAIQARLVREFNSQALAIRTIDAHVLAVPTPGPSYGGQAQYSHAVDAILYAARPGSIRFLAQAPFIGKTLFDLASDGTGFQIALPSRHEFLIGRYADSERSPRPLENIRPQHLLDALIWPELPNDNSAKLRMPAAERGAPAYRLVVSRGDSAAGRQQRTISFDGKTLRVQRIEIDGAEGAPVSEMTFAEWMNVGAPNDAAGDACFPRHITIHRPQEDYRLEIQVSRISVNEDLGRQRFHLSISPGLRPVNVGVQHVNPPEQ